MLITPEYLAQQKALHAGGHYGTGGGDKAEAVRQACLWGRRPLLDYGAGQCKLAEALGPAYRVTNYDPCVVGLDTPPEPHYLVVCSDVLEHIEPECLGDVLRDIRRVTMDKALFFISTVPAFKTLPDGRNAHLIVQSKEWWHEQITAAGFHVMRSGDGVTDSDAVVGCWLEAMPC